MVSSTIKVAVDVNMVASDSEYAVDGDGCYVALLTTRSFTWMLPAVGARSLRCFAIRLRASAAVSHDTEIPYQMTYPARDVSVRPRPFAQVLRNSLSGHPPPSATTRDTITSDIYSQRREGPSRQRSIVTRAMLRLLPSCTSSPSRPGLSAHSKG